jgi:adenylate cyclase
MTGEKISHYQLHKEIFKDYAGTVYRATDRNAEKTVMLRVIPDSFFDSQSARQQFIKDMIAMTKVSHPHVGEVYGVEEADGSVLVSAEDYDPPPSSMAGRGRDSGNVKMWFEGMLAGLGAVHENGIVHGGLCPAAIALTDDGAPRIHWFGTGRFNRGKPAVAHAVEDLSYMAPEVIQGEDINERSDLWSAGVVLYEWIAGKKPFRGDTTPILAHEILTKNPARPSGDPGRDTAALARIAFALMKKNPADRPGSVLEATNRLKVEFLGEEEELRPRTMMVRYLSCGGADPDRSYVAGGVTEHIISRLSGVEHLQLASKHDSLTCRGRDVDPQELGRCMGVAQILQGAIRTSGETLRVEVQIIDVETGFETWSSSFEGAMDDVLALQRTLTLGVVDAVGVPVSGEERAYIAKNPTTDGVAYDFYMRGRHFASTGGKRNTEAAIRMYEFATASDPSFAAAHAGLAEVFIDMFMYYDGASLWLDRVSAEGARALELDPDLAAARFAIGVGHFYQKDYDSARGEFEKIARSRPRCYEAYRWLGIVADVTEEFDKAIEFYKKSAEIKPCSVEPWLYLNMTHRRLGDVEAAKQAAQRFLEVGLKTLRIIPDDPVTLSRFCVIYSLFGDHGKARAALSRVLESDPDDGLVLYNCAATYALLGDEKRACECLSNALNRGYKNVRDWIEGDPDFDGIRDSEAFRRLLTEFDLQYGN